MMAYADDESTGKLLFQIEKLEDQLIEYDDTIGELLQALQILRKNYELIVFGTHISGIIKATENATVYRKQRENNESTPVNPL